MYRKRFLMNWKHYAEDGEDLSRSEVASQQNSSAFLGHDEFIVLARQGCFMFAAKSIS